MHRQGHAAVLQRRYQGLADAELGDRSNDIDLGIGRKGFRGGPHGFLVARRECAQRVLDAIAHLPEHGLRDIVRILRTEIDADALRADQADHLFDALHQRRRRVVEQQMRLVEEEHQLGFVEVAGLGQVLEQLGKHPEQEGRIQLRLEDQLVGGENADDAAPGHVLAHEVGQIERGFAEEMIGAGFLQRQQGALDRGQRGGADQSVLFRNDLGVLRGKVEHGAQILEVEQQQALVVGASEHDLEHALLGIVEFEQAAEQMRTHFGNRGANRMAQLAVDVPEHDRIGVRAPVNAELVDARLEPVAHGAGLRQAGEVALDVGEKDRHAKLGKSFSQQHQTDRFSGAGGAGDHAVAIGVACVEPDSLVALADQDIVHQ